MKPNKISYSTVINAYALSKDPLKAHKAFSILQRMHQLHKAGDDQVRPNTVTYNTVLNSCASSCPIAVKDKLEQQGLDKLPSLPEMVRKLYKQMVEKDAYLKPDHFTFGTVLKGVENLFWGEEDQVEFGKLVFREACERGQVSFGVLSHLRQALPVEVYRELLPPEATCPNRPEALLNHIPPEWTRNVRDGRSRRRQKYVSKSKAARR